MCVGFALIHVARLVLHVIADFIVLVLVLLCNNNFSAVDINLPVDCWLVALYIYCCR